MARRKRNAFIGPLPKNQPSITINTGIKSSQTTKGRGKPRRPRGRGRASISNGASQQMISKVCGQVNPFCAASRGAKWSDMASAFTIPFQSRFMISLISDANGAGAAYINPLPVATYNKNVTVVANAVTAWGATSSDPSYATMLTLSTDFRVVSWGYHYITTVSDDNANGTIISTEVGYDITGTTGFNLSNLTIGTNAHLHAIRGGEFFYIGKPIDDSAAEFRTQNAATSRAWSAGLLMWSGAFPSLPIGYVEIIINYEFKPYADSINTQFVTPPQTDHPIIAQAADFVRSKITGSVDAGSKGSSVIHEVVEGAAVAALAALAAPMMPEIAAIGAVGRAARIANQSGHLLLTM